MLFVDLVGAALTITAIASKFGIALRGSAEFSCTPE